MIEILKKFLCSMLVFVVSLIVYLAVDWLAVNFASYSSRNIIVGTSLGFLILLGFIPVSRIWEYSEKSHGLRKD